MTARVRVPPGPPFIPLTSQGLTHDDPPCALTAWFQAMRSPLRIIPDVIGHRSKVRTRQHTRATVRTSKSSQMAFAEIFCISEGPLQETSRSGIQMSLHKSGRKKNGTCQIDRTRMSLRTSRVVVLIVSCRVGAGTNNWLQDAKTESLRKKE